MISIVVPVWRDQVYEKVSKPWIVDQVERFDAQLIEVRGAKSIFQAHEKGRKQAKHRHVMYVHDDVRLLTPDDLSAQVPLAFERYPFAALFGPVGKTEKKKAPWWLNHGHYVGHWCRRHDRGWLIYQYADGNGRCPERRLTDDPVKEWTRFSGRWKDFANAGFVDGFYLIEDRERLTVPWDTKTFGANWHGYDIDRCCQVRELGYTVMVTPWLFLHDNAGHAGYKGTDPTVRPKKDDKGRQAATEGDALWLEHLDDINDRLREKWGLQ